MNGDILGLIFVYVYVAVLLVVSEKVLSKHPTISRKFLHIMVGNVAFILPVFVTREVMAFVAAGPFILFTFLMSPYTPIKSIKGRTSAAGHSMGLVYYAITWTILAYLFFDNMIVIAIGILAMSYGDGFASIMGVRFGHTRYKILDDEKSYVGSISMFLFTFVTIIVAVFYYDFVINQMEIFILVLISFIAALAEGITPKGLDNLSVPFLTAFLFWYIFIM